MEPHNALVFKAPVCGEDREDGPIFPDDAGVPFGDHPNKVVTLGLVVLLLPLCPEEVVSAVVDEDVRCGDGVIFTIDFKEWVLDGVILAKLL